MLTNIFRQQITVRLGMAWQGTLFNKHFISTINKPYTQTDSKSVSWDFNSKLLTAGTILPLSHWKRISLFWLKLTSETSYPQWLILERAIRAPCMGLGQTNDLKIWAQIKTDHLHLKCNMHQLNPNEYLKLKNKMENWWTIDVPLKVVL